VNVQIQQQSAMHSQVAKYLADTTKVDLPARVTAQQAARTLERRRLELMYRGIEPHKIEEHMAELRAASSVAAQRDLKMFFVMFRVAEQLNTQVTQQEVNQRITQMAMQRNVRPDQMAQELRRTNQVNALVTQIRDHKSMDAIIAKAKISEMKAEEFNEWAKKQG
jgi:FKBP-type peptidyl-prolyl cis-trans isomerase (trigger factor)